MSTFLTSAFDGWTDADWAAAAERRVKEESARSLANTICEGHAQSFSQGQLTLENFVLALLRAVKAPDLRKADGPQIVGYWLINGHSKEQSTSGRRGPKGAPPWHRELIPPGVEYAKKQGAVVSRSPAAGKVSAFDFVADYLTQRGLPTTAYQVERWHLEYAEKSNTADD